jgi:ATP-binding cassette subfamily F protein 3
VSRARARGAEAPARLGRQPAVAVPVVPTARAAAPTPVAPPPIAGKRRDERKVQAQSRAQLANRTRPLRMEIQQIDGRLEKLGSEKAEIEAALANGSVAGHEMADSGRRLNHIAAETAMLEERWLMLHTEIESMSSTGD